MRMGPSELLGCEGRAPNTGPDGAAAMSRRLAKWLGFGAWIAATCALVVPAARASLVEALDLAALVAESEQVVVGRVLSESSHYDERGRIVTDAALQVEETLKGDRAPGAAIMVRRLGGVVDDIGMRVSGEASFTVGESVLLFGARTRAGGALRAVGMAQGAIRIVEKNGERWAQSGGVAGVRRDALTAFREDAADSRAARGRAPDCWRRRRRRAWRCARPSTCRRRKVPGARLEYFV